MGEDIEVDMEPVRQSLNRRASLALYKKVRSKSRNEFDEAKKAREWKMQKKKEEDDYDMKKRLDRMHRPVVNPLTGKPFVKNSRLTKSARKEVRNSYKSKMQEYMNRHPEKTVKHDKNNNNNN